jgi:hypothetical protein
LERRWIDNTGGTMRTMGLETRGRIGKKMFATLHAKPVTAAGTDSGGTGEISAFLMNERMKYAWDVLRRARFEHNIDTLGFRRPDAKMRPVLID